MTEVEALALKPGDRVEARFGRTGWRIAVVASIVLWDQEQINNARWNYKGVIVGGLRHVGVRSICRTNSGRQSSIVYKVPHKLRPYNPTLDPVTGNVFSDYLESEGFPEAAQCLRRRFPLATGEV